jgi:hypothetical protein
MVMRSLLESPRYHGGPDGVAPVEATRLERLAAATPVTGGSLDLGPAGGVLSVHFLDSWSRPFRGSRCP